MIDGQKLTINDKRRLNSELWSLCEKRVWGGCGDGMDEVMVRRNMGLWTPSPVPPPGPDILHPAQSPPDPGGTDAKSAAEH